MTSMEQERKKCMVCGKAMPLKGGICDPCQERIRREAMGEHVDARIEAEKELKRHGVTPDSGTKKK
jgi:predicted amidophosphoribosyltransferase